MAGKSQQIESKADKVGTPSKALNRMSTGLKLEITKKDMIKLTSKNYEQLPEIKRKKYEESKKEDLMKRIATVKDLEKRRR